MQKTFLFLNISGDFLSIAQRIKAEGYPIYFYKTKGQAKGREDTGIGFLDKREIVDDFYEVLNKINRQDLICIVDDNSRGDEMDFLKNNGYTVIGGSTLGDKIEYSRSAGTKLMQKIGLEVPEEYHFSSINEGISFLEKQPEDIRFVFKPHGDEFAGSSKTYTGRNRQDLLDYLEWIKVNCVEKHYSIDQYLLQEFVDGIEADFSAYFNGHEFMEGSCNIDIEEKKSGDGNKGEACGCMGNVVMFLKESRYFEEYIKKLIPLLRNYGYIGQISINNIFAYGNKKYKDGTPYGLEFTPRFGWDAHLTELAILHTYGIEPCDFYQMLINGEPLELEDQRIGCGIRIYSGSVNLKKDDVSGRILSFPKSIIDNLFFYSVSYKNDKYIVEDNPVLVVNTVGKNLQKTIDDCYSTTKKINLTDVYYRTEIGQRAGKVIKFLQKYKWI